SLWQEKADFVFTLANPFHRYWPYRTRIETPEFAETQEYRAYQQAGRVTVTYRFGQAQEGRQRKTVANDDVKGNGGQQHGRQ
ncbi:MAG TPA: hypothetical protein VK364_08385, partial [Hymenobacter sp.]|nr:hypothetical protein [Hymenobacter sp.]